MLPTVLISLCGKGRKARIEQKLGLANYELYEKGASVELKIFDRVYLADICVD
jgi:hypothetical protein